MAEHEDKKVAALQFTGLVNKGRKYISPHLRVGCTIYPNPLDNEPYVPARKTAARRIDWDAKEAEASIIGFSWTKLLGPPSGQWKLQIKPKFDLSTGEERLNLHDQEIVDGDWIDIAILRNGIRIPLCRGVVDSVRRHTQSVGGATRVIYTLTGRDHGAFFEYPITWNSLWARTLAELASGLFTRRIDIIGGRPDQLFRALINGTFQGGEDAGTPAGQWTLPQSLTDFVKSGEGKLGRLFDILKIITFASEKGGKHLRGAYYNAPKLWAVGEQQLHETLGQWVNPLLNEFFYDLVPGKAFLPKDHGLAGFMGADSFKVSEGGAGPLGPENETFVQVPSEYESDTQEFGTIAAIIRERPFPNSTDKKDSLWFHLPTWTIPTWLIASSDLGRSGHQRYNVFELLADFGLGGQKEQAAYAIPVWLKDGIKTHGLRAFPKGQTRFTAINKGGQAEWIKERAIWLQLLLDWFAPNPYLLQGSISIKVPLPEIRIGHRVVISTNDPAKSIQAYVEGVDISIQAPTPTAGVRGETTLHVTRGFQGSDDELMAAVMAQATNFEQVF